MKMKRTLALVLALVLLVSALPMAAMAADSIQVRKNEYENRKDALNQPLNTGTNEQVSIGDKAVTFKPTDEEKYIIGSDGRLYDYVGMHLFSDVMTSEEAKNAWKAAAGSGKSSVTIPKDDGTIEWEKAYLNAFLIYAYATHNHKLSNWYFDNNNHWRECLVCKKFDGFHEPFLFMNWHYDGDGNDKCDVCAGPIIWYDITVEDVKGAKLVEIEGDKEMKARYNDKVVVEMEAEEGYILESIRFYKVRKDGTSEEITRYVETPGEVYRIVMPNFDVKIVPIVYPKG